MPTCASYKHLSHEDLCMEVLSLSKYHRKYEEEMTRYNTFVGSLIIAMNVYNSDCESKIIPLDDITERDVVGKRAQCRAIVTRLELMHCPHRVSLKQLSELDFPALLPMVEWVVNINVIKRIEEFDFRETFITHFDQKFDTEMLAISEYRTQLSKITEYAMAQSCTYRTFLSQVFGKNMTAEERMSKYAWIIRLHQEGHLRNVNCMGMNPPAEINRPPPMAMFGEDTASDIINYRTFLTDVLRKINIDQDLMYLDYRLENEARAHFQMKNSMEYFKEDLKELEAVKVQHNESALKAVSDKLEEQLCNLKAYKKHIQEHKNITKQILLEWGLEYIVNKNEVKNDKRTVYTKLMDCDVKYDKVIKSCKDQIYQLRKVIAKVKPSGKKQVTSFNGSLDLEGEPLDTSHVHMILRLAYHITQGMEESQSVPEIDQSSPDKAVLYYEAFFGYVDDLTQMLFDYYWKAIFMIEKRKELMRQFDGLRNKMREKQRKMVRYDQLLDKLFQANNAVQQTMHLLKQENVQMVEIRRDITELITKADSRNVAKNVLLKELLSIELL